jgi:hypothetical protein
MGARQIPHTNSGDGWCEWRQQQEEIQYFSTESTIDSLDVLVEPYAKLT